MKCMSCFSKKNWTVVWCIAKTFRSKVENPLFNKLCLCLVYNQESKMNNYMAKLKNFGYIILKNYALVIDRALKPPSHFKTNDQFHWTMWRIQWFEALSSSDGLSYLFKFGWLVYQTFAFIFYIYWTFQLLISQSRLF